MVKQAKQPKNEAKIIVNGEEVLRQKLESDMWYSLGATIKVSKSGEPNIKEWFKCNGPRNI